MLGKIVVEPCEQKIGDSFEDPNKRNLVEEVTVSEPKVYNRGGYGFFSFISFLFISNKT